MPRKRRMMILTEGRLGIFMAKTATCLVRYCPDEVCCILDSHAAKSGKPLNEFIGIGAGIPIARDVKEALRYAPNQLVIGIAPVGGRLPEAWRRIVLQAIHCGMDVVNGLHHILNDDPRFARAAKRRNIKIHDVRVPPPGVGCAIDRLRNLKQRRVSIVGADCSIGKMLTAVELDRGLRESGWDSEFIATGQTGIMIAGSGIAVDHVLSDYVNGAAEMLCWQRRKREIVVVEGQGSVYHPAYSAVTVGLLHGAMPHTMVYVHAPNRKGIGHYEQFPIIPLKQGIQLVEDLMKPLFPSRVSAISLNTVEMGTAAADKAMKEIEAETGLPASDPIRHGVGKLVLAIEKDLSHHKDTKTRR